MAIDLATANALIAKRGVQYPANYPGPRDQWAVDWLWNAVNAGDPEAIAATGSSQQSATDATTGSTPQGSQYTGTGGQETFAQKVRRIAREKGWSEDFARFSDAQIVAWQPFWDDTAGAFRSEHDQFADMGAVFEKPTDLPAGYSLHGTQAVKTEDLPWWAEGSAQAPPGAAAAPAAGQSNDSLANALWGMFQGRQGFFADDPKRTDDDTLTGKLLSGGGLFWGGQGFTLPDLSASMPAATTPAAPVSGGGLAPRVAVPETVPGQAPAIPDEFLNQNPVEATPLSQALMSLFPSGTRRWWDSGSLSR